MKIEREQATEKEIEFALKIVEQFLRKRIDKHGRGKFVSIHEALGVLAEEYHETIGAVTSNDHHEFLQEMLDCAISAIWAYVSFSLIDFSPPDEAVIERARQIAKEL